ncbi:hypothetical protein M2163_001571 [Streptomyces sp. SAI-135]|nr:hypothetical protein [Streptomyces sp. SAI-135]
MSPTVWKSPPSSRTWACRRLWSVRPCCTTSRTPPCPPGRVAERFGEDVARLVSAVRLAELDMVAPDDLLLDTAAPTLEQAVLAICPADRLHNLRTIAFLAPAKQRRKASETLEVLVPLARATGLTDVRSELEALAASVPHPPSSAFAVTTRVLALLSLVLPAQQRARWREEWQAELTCLRSWQARARFTLHVRHAPGALPGSPDRHRNCRTTLDADSAREAVGGGGCCDGGDRQRRRSRPVRRAGRPRGRHAGPCCQQDRQLHCGTGLALSGLRRPGGCAVAVHYRTDMLPIGVGVRE